jgi:hypothetical protein
MCFFEYPKTNRPGAPAEFIFDSAIGVFASVSALGSGYRRSDQNGGNANFKVLFNLLDT